RAFSSEVDTGSREENASTQKSERVEKGDCRLTLPDLVDFAEGQLLVLALPHRFETVDALDVLAQLNASAADGVWLAASLLYR
ncbi:hypothetical protein NQ292_27730, partial [Escherichia coli]|nr:hypothetical protein [Escherichia coli]